MASEQWKPVAGFAAYDVSSHGRVRSWWQKRDGAGRVVDRSGKPVYLTPLIGRGGRRFVILYGNSGTKNTVLSRLVLTAFKGKAPKGHAPAYTDGNLANCRAANLSWISRGEAVRAAMVATKAKKAMEKTSARKKRTREKSAT